MPFALEPEQPSFSCICVNCQLRSHGDDLNYFVMVHRLSCIRNFEVWLFETSVYNTKVALFFFQWCIRSRMHVIDDKVCRIS
jgi:hypothetical protein